MTIIRYQAHLEFHKRRRLVLNEETLISTAGHKTLIKELILILPHPNPLFYQSKFRMSNQFIATTYEHNVNEIMNLFQLLKIMIIIRVALMLSTYFTSSAQRVCTMYAVKPGYLFVIKSLMKAHPFQVLFVALIWSIFIFAHALRICERPLFQEGDKIDFNHFKNAIWTVLVTMTTVGYGDFYARTDFGRIVSFFVCIWGVFVVSLMVVTLTNFLNMGVLETKAFSIIERLATRRDLRESAFHLVRHFLMMAARSKRKEKVSSDEISMLRRKINEFKSLNRQYKSMLDEATNISEEMTRHFEFLRDEIKNSVDKQNKIAEEALKLADRIDRIHRVLQEDMKNRSLNPHENFLTLPGHLQMSKSHLLLR
eukprot:TRINITY_DN7287_c0_g1_i2.p1 TRINITY_DN7287_c0_g1~~TRINITY_DN7287_c0_g1_i2.p1  ORF type:complete len:368 (+),score=43.57 TRINITY_DN7287_c0_g1_i2:116-1219(+)